VASKQETSSKKSATKSGATVKKVSKKKATTKKSVAKKTSGVRAKISPRERYEMIATMAFYRAEQRNFEPGHDVEDWLECEGIIDGMLGKS
jgi:hypothetical protein